MPLYEYRCCACSQEFEALVRGGEAASCPSCGSQTLERILSSFMVSSEGTRQSALKKGKKEYADKDRDRKIAYKEEIEHHHH